jgi:hypothetical protein
MLALCTELRFAEEAMPQDLPVTPDLMWRVLVAGALLALVLVVVAHLLKRLRMEILFAVLLMAALAYVWFAYRAQAGPAWLLVEAVGVVIYGAIGWRGLRSSPSWLAAAWALHPVWDVGLHWLGPGRAFVHPLRYAIPCISFDLLIAAYIAYLVSREPKFAAEPTLRASAR